MPLENISEVIRSGLAYERTRAEVASYNLAMANVALSPDMPASQLRVVPPTSFSARLGLGGPQVQAQELDATREVHDPSHPLADKNGMVHYPRIAAAEEMATLVSATRAYEADIRAYNSLRAMTLKAFEIGK